MIEPAAVLTTTCPRCSSPVTATPDPVSGTVVCAGCGTRFDPRAEATAAAADDHPHDAWQPRPGERVGAYTLIDELGRGGMSTVWRARQDSLEREVAVKILHAHLAADRDLRRRFAREAEAMVLLDHPHLVPVIDRGQHHDRPYLVTTLLGTRTLRGEMQAGPLAPLRVAEVADQILDGLAHAHARGLVHRDVKPENIIVDDAGGAHLADFGIAQVARALDGHTLTHLTRTDVVLGTVAYMAPEQSVASSGVDHRCDLYALGVVCYEALTGHLPQGRFEDPSEHLTGLSEPQRAAWDRFVLACLERDTERRPADAAATRDLLEPMFAPPPRDEREQAQAQAQARPDTSGERDWQRRFRFGPVVIDVESDFPPEAHAIMADAERRSGESRADARRTLDEVRRKLHAASAYADNATAAHWQRALETIDAIAERYQGRATPHPAQAAPEPTPAPVHGRRLYRDPQDKWLGGVLGGLAAWTGINATWLRLAALFGPLVMPGVGYTVVIGAYLVGLVVIPQCSDARYRPYPLNANWPRRPDGWLLGVCALAEQRTTIPTALWRIASVVLLPFGSWVVYLVLGILLPSAASRRYPPRPAPPVDADASAPEQPARAPTGLRFWGMTALALATAAVLAHANPVATSEKTAFLWWAAWATGAAALLGGWRRDGRPFSGPLGGLALGVGGGGLVLIAALGAGEVDAAHALGLGTLVLLVLIAAQALALIANRAAATAALLASTAALTAAGAALLGDLPAALGWQAGATVLVVGLASWCLTACALFPLIAWIAREQAEGRRSPRLAAALIALGSLGSQVVLLFTLAELGDALEPRLQLPNWAALLTLGTLALIVLLAGRDHRGRTMVSLALVVLGAAAASWMMVVRVQVPSHNGADFSYQQLEARLPQSAALRIDDGTGAPWVLPLQLEQGTSAGQSGIGVQRIERSYRIALDHSEPELGELVVDGRLEASSMIRSGEHAPTDRGSLTLSIRHDGSPLTTVRERTIDPRRDRIPLSTHREGWTVMLLLSAPEDGLAVPPEDSLIEIDSAPSTPALAPEDTF